MRNKKLLLVSIVILVLALPMVASAQAPTGYTTGITVANLDATNDATIVIEFINQDGTTGGTLSDTVPAGGSNAYFPLTSVSAGFNGSAVVSSNTPIASLVNVLGNTSAGQGAFGGATYVGATGGGSTVFIPQVFRSFFGINSWFNIQNTGATSTNVTVTYTGNNGTCSESPVSIPSKAAHTFNMTTSSAPCMVNGTLASVNVSASSGGTIVSAVVTYDSDSLLSYNGFSSLGSTSAVMPTVIHKFVNSRTGIGIQNTGTQATSVTLSYTPSAGFPGQACQQTLSIQPGATANFGDSGFFEQAGSPCGPMSNSSQGFVGAARITANSTSQTVVAVVNTVTVGSPNGAAYTAGDASSAGKVVSFPNIFDNYFGLVTGTSVANVGTQPTNISCTFSGTSYTISANNVQPGAALTDAQSGKIFPGYIGAATCTATGGDELIFGVGTQVGGSGDKLLYYEGGVG